MSAVKMNEVLSGHSPTLMVYAGIFSTEEIALLLTVGHHP